MEKGKTESTYNFMLSPYGAEYGVTVGQHDRTDELNLRMNARMFPDTDLQPNFDPRPVSTKYSIFPIVDSYARTVEPFKPYLDYYPEVVFNPGNAKAPIDGFIRKIDLESDLSNRNAILKKNDLGNKYIPSLHSDLYNVVVKSTDNGAAIAAHPLLFSPFVMNSSTDDFVYSSTVGNDQFHNHTRTQLRAT
jgi:hypothetical protein